jgi:hypothetical protein
LLKFGQHEPTYLVTSPAMSIESAHADPTTIAMLGELAALLDAVPSSRRVLQHLAVMEQTLKVHGLRGLTRLPEVVLAKARLQLMSLPLQDSHDALAQLLTLLTLSIEPPEAPAPAACDAYADTCLDTPDEVAAHGAAHPREAKHSDQFLSSFLTDDKLHVSEASHSEFLRELNGPPQSTT